MNTFTFPKRSVYELERNYFWEKYFSKSLIDRHNWTYIDYDQPFEKIDLIYSPNLKLNMKASINGNIYHIVETVSDKIKINRNIKKIFLSVIRHFLIEAKYNSLFFNMLIIIFKKLIPYLEFQNLMENEKHY